MRIVLARLQSLKAVALSNEGKDSKSAAIIDQMTALGTPVDIQLPAVLNPASDPAAPEPEVVSMPVPTTIAEAHDAVQAGVITRQDAVDAGVIQHVDQLPPSPAEVAAGVENVAPPTPVTPAVVPQADPGDETTATPVPVPVAPVVDTPAPAASADPVPAPSAPPAAVDAAPAQVSPPADAAAAGSVPAPAADTQPSVAPSAPISDADRLKALEDRVTADEAKEQAFEDEVKSGKVSRQ